ncbi:hypothetical protein [Streptomyces sp. NRRL F-2580]|uniref:hypothetical protein n=1 Tax=Streptomyces sp. NRRL F-2580 TaxID=1463841 RepID=UPI0004CB9428|nr:hypothetical protein [Streptomyces sp. NRRL F-2580]
MINSKRIRLALVALVASGAALAAAPAQAAGTVTAVTRTQASIAVQAESPISLMRCRDDGQGCPLPAKPDCGRKSAPTTIDLWSQHMRDRMNERTFTEEQAREAVRIGADDAWCQVDEGTWLYDAQLSGGGRLVVVVGWDRASRQSTAVTGWWKK